MYPTGDVRLRSGQVKPTPGYCLTRASPLFNVIVKLKMERPMAEAHVLHMERVLAASPEKVFDAWTRPELLSQWWGPEGTHLGPHDLDVREGGTWRTVMVSDADGTEYIVGGVYRVIDRPKRLVLTWAWEEDGKPGHETELSILLEAQSGGTKLTLLQREFETAEGRDNHNGGWTSSLARLERLFAGAPAA
jgi:uncharacterized protein YndB with AHSA1/START domain